MALFGKSSRLATGFFPGLFGRIASSRENNAECLTDYKGDLRGVVVGTLAFAARRQTEILASSGRMPVVFVDDPVVSAFGSRWKGIRGFPLASPLISGDATYVTGSFQASGFRLPASSYT